MGQKTSFSRNSLGTLEHWWGSERRKPLLLRGARQVGKSTVVRQFAQIHALDLLEINLERHLDLNEIFRTQDMQKILTTLQSVLSRKIGPRSLLFLDEIQATPYAIASLRYFYEDHPEIPVIAAGSLLEFALGEGVISMPVGRIQYLYMTPVTFSEYLQANGEDYALEVLRSFDVRNPPPEPVHKKLLQLQREYLFVGGMPEAVQAFREEKELIRKFAASEQVLRSILDTFRDDFHKYASKTETIRLQRIFQRVAANLNRKVKYSEIDPGENARETKKVIQLLTQAKVVSPVYHSSSNGIPLGAEANLDVFKLLFLDVGLANYLLGLTWNQVMNLDERALIHEGPLAEQYIGQSLLSTFSKDGMMEPQLHYWLREGKSSNAEVDFVVQIGAQIIPIEVKSGKSGSIKSMLQFVAEKQSRLAVRFDLGTSHYHPICHAVGGQEVRFNFLSLPLYVVDELPRILNTL